MKKNINELYYFRFNFHIPVNVSYNLKTYCRIKSLQLMYKNYFFLNRLIIELNHALKDYVLNSAFSQEKNKLVLEFKNDGDIKFIEASVDPGFPYLNLRDSFSRAKKNTIDFFSEYLPAKLIQFEIAEDDRIIKISFENFDLLFSVRGKYTNLHLIDKNNNSLSFKDEEAEVENNFIAEMKQHNFIQKFNDTGKLSAYRSLPPEKLREVFPILGKEIILEAQRRAENKNDEFPEIVSQIISEIGDRSITVFTDEGSNEVYISVSTFSIFPFTKRTEFDNLIEALNFYLAKRHSLDDLTRKKKLVEKYLTKSLDRTASKINNLKSQLDLIRKEEEYRNIGNLLLINLNKIRKGMEKVEVDDVYSDNKKIIIKLKPTLSPRQNAEFYFDKAKSEKLSFEKNYKLLKSSESEFKRLSEIKSRFDSSDSIEQLKEIMKELKIKDNVHKTTQEDLKLKFKHYIIEGKFHLYVGKDSHSNDLLTIKFAKQNDYWFHARGVSGSHAVLRIDNTKETVPKNILKAAASIAAFHSKAKTAGLAPVSYTFKKYVTKKKGMEPGKVALLKEDVLLVHPEIPASCQFITEE